MNDDLYNSPMTSAPVANNQASSLNIFEIGLDINSILYWLNIVAFAWTLFYSLVFVVEFVFYRVKFPDGEVVDREQVGVQAINQAAGLWWGFLICAVLYLIYYVQADGFVKSGIGWIAIIAYLLKILVGDMPVIPVIGKYLGKPGEIIQDFIENLASNSLKALTVVVDGVMSIFNS